MNDCPNESFTETNEQSLQIKKDTATGSQSAFFSFGNEVIYSVTENYPPIYWIQ